MSIYTHVVYLTVYFGDKLPPKTHNDMSGPRRYIGSTKIENVLSGYKGSVASQKYSSIWSEETKNSPDLFRVRILSYHENDIQARTEEKRLQKKYNVVKSGLYVNLALASPNGYFGKPDIGREFSTETREKLSNNRKGKTYEEIFGEEKAKELKEKRRKQLAERNRSNTGKSLSEETKSKMSSYIWITDGVTDKRHPKDNEMPHGWKRGRSNGVNKKGTPFFKNPEAKEKARQTKIERYGDENYNKSKRVYITQQE